MLRLITNTVGLTKKVVRPPPQFTVVSVTATDYCESQSGMLCGKHAINNLLQEDKLTAINSPNLVVDATKQNACGSLALALKSSNKHLKINAKALCLISPAYCIGDSFYSDDALEYVLHNLLRFRIVTNTSPIMQNADEWTKQLMIDIRQKIAPDTPGKKADIRDQNFLGILFNKSNSHWTCITRGFTGFPDNKEYTYLDSQNPSSAICLSRDEIVPFLKTLDKSLKPDGTKDGGIYSYVVIFNTYNSYKSKTLENINSPDRTNKINEFKNKRYLKRLMKALVYFLPADTFPGDIDPVQHMMVQPEIYNKETIESALKQDYKFTVGDLAILEQIDDLTDEDLVKLLKKYKNANTLRAIAAVANRLPSPIGSRELVPRLSTPPANVGLVPAPTKEPLGKLRPTMANINMSWLNAPAATPLAKPLAEPKPAITYEIDPNLEKQIMNLYNSWTVKGGKSFKRKTQRKTRKRRATYKL